MYVRKGDISNNKQQSKNNFTLLPCNHARLILFAISSTEYWKRLPVERWSEHSLQTDIRRWYAALPRLRASLCADSLCPAPQRSLQLSKQLPSTPLKAHTLASSLVVTRPRGTCVKGWAPHCCLPWAHFECSLDGLLRELAAFLGCWGPNSVIVWFLDSNKNKVRERGSGHL